MLGCPRCGIYASSRASMDTRICRRQGCPTVREECTGEDDLSMLDKAVRLQQFKIPFKSLRRFKKLDLSRDAESASRNTAWNKFLLHAQLWAYNNLFNLAILPSFFFPFSFFFLFLLSLIFFYFFNTISHFTSGRRFAFVVLDEIYSKSFLRLCDGNACLLFLSNDIVREVIDNWLKSKCNLAQSHFSRWIIWTRVARRDFSLRHTLDLITDDVILQSVWAVL